MRILLDTSFLLPSMGVEITGASEILGMLKGEENVVMQDLTPGTPERGAGHKAPLPFSVALYRFGSLSLAWR